MSGLKEDQYLQQNNKNITEETLKNTLEYGVGYLHDGLTQKERQYVKQLYTQGIIRILVVAYTLSWEIGDIESHIVIIMDAEIYDG